MQNNHDLDHETEHFHKLLRASGASEGTFSCFPSKHSILVNWFEGKSHIMLHFILFVTLVINYGLGQKTIET